MIPIPTPAVDLLVRLHAWDTEKQTYPVEAWTNDGGHYLGEGFSIDEERLLHVEGNAQAYGLYLFYRLFTGPIRRAYDTAIGQAQTQCAPLRLRLWIDPAATRLHALAWERLYHMRQETASPIAASGDLPMSRYVSLEQAEPEPFTQRPIRMLFVLANPFDLKHYRLAPLDTAAELSNLLAALETLLQTGALRLTVLARLPDNLSPDLQARLEQAQVECLDEPATLAALTRRLAQQDGVHIVHFLGHGNYHRRDAATALYFEEPSGNTRIVRDTTIVTQLQAITPLPRLIFLASCESAKHDPDQVNPFVGLAPKLVAAGVPAVVAMQDVVPIAATQRLARNFYRYLLEHGTVDRALNQSRLVIFDEQQTTWAIPTLFTRLRDGQLFAPDPARAALTAMTTAEVFNPLPPDGAYLPLEVLHLTGALETAKLERLQQENIPGRGLIETVFDILAPRKAEIAPHGPSCVALIGDAGMGKSTEMRHIGHATAQDSLADDACRVVIPAYIRLDDLSHEPVIDAQDVLRLITEALAPFCPVDGPLSPAALLAAQTGPVLRVLVDGSDNIPDHLRRRAWQALSTVIRHHARHEYVITYMPAQMDSHLLPISDFLVLQTLAPRGIRHYLKERLGTPAAQKLYRAIEATQLFDLAAQPWLLFKMLQQTQQGRMPRTHAQVLENLVDDAIAEIAPDRGMRARATRTLYALARQMQFALRSTLDIDTAFQVMADLRKNRGYNLETLYQELIRCEMLQPVGDEALRFARANLRAYGCAQAILHDAEMNRLLDDITATLGRHTRYRWWEDTLVILSGLMDDPNVLIRQLLYGVALNEGEQLFLAARCIQECRSRELDAQLVSYVTRALIWRMDSARELRVTRRARIAEILGQLRAPEAIPALARVACEKVRVDSQQQPAYEYNNVRLAAVKALQRIAEPPYTAIAARAPKLARLLNYWADSQVEALIPYLVTPGDDHAGYQAIAAFALGDLKTPRAIDVVIRVFLSPTFSQATRQAAATALTLLDAALITQRVILPLLLTPEPSALSQPQVTPEKPHAGCDDARDPAQAEEQRSIEATRENRQRWYPELAYLIGRLRVQHPAARAFLHRCVNEYPDVALKGLALQSLGWLYDTRSKELCEAVALGDFSKLKLQATPITAAQADLQRKAINALYYLGDAETLRRLQSRPTTWSPELEQAFYWAIEEILVRQNTR